MFLFPGGSTVSLTPVTINQEDYSIVSIDRATTLTFSSQSLGTAAAGRRIAILIATNGYADTNATAVTVGGSSASKLVSSDNNPAQQEASIWDLALATGTSGDVVVTYDGSGDDSTAIYVYSINNAGASSANGWDEDKSTSNALTATITIPANGAAIAMAWGQLGAGTWTWGGSMTKDTDNALEAFEVSSGIATPTTEQTGTTVSADPGTTSNPSHMVCAAWPAA